MANKHPYTSGTGALVKSIQHFRKTIPSTINASVLKKLGLAPKNESYLINILQFLHIINEDGTPTEEARSVFTQHNDADFANAFGKMVKNAYKDLFELHGDDAWTLDQEKLVTYFRKTDQTSSEVGKRQAFTFIKLAELSGNRDFATSSNTSIDKQVNKQKPRKASKALNNTIPPAQNHNSKRQDLGLTVRIEINLPASEDQETYDKIFKSIRENLLNE